jgi:hypothetical protein
MKNEILANLNNPIQLERLYRTNKAAFKRAFSSLYPELSDNNLAEFWNARLCLGRDEISWGSSRDLIFVVIASLLAGFFAKLPAILSLNEEFFYTRNAGFIVFPALAAWFGWKHRLSLSQALIIAGGMLASLVFINFLPQAQKSDTLLLSCIHLPVLLWALTGFAFTGEARNNPEKRLGYLRFNGDLVVMTTLILLAGALMSGVTIGLFELIGLRIENFYFEYVVIFGLPAAPILGTYLTRTNPQLVNKVSPVIAKIFSPVVLTMLVAYLIAIIYSGKNPYSDREFLLLFNVLLAGVMAIIFFSIAESSRNNANKLETWILFLLSVVTIIVNGIALSAILFRISEWGFTPNRTAVLGANVLFLLNLLLVTAKLFTVLTNKAGIEDVGKVISTYLPIYIIWAFIVTVLFPLVFAFQ